MTASLRDRKKQQTRRSLIESAHKLFAERGYNDTTLADITEAANCSPRTFFQYFTAKEDLLLVGIDELWNDLSAALGERPKNATTVEVVRAWIRKTTEKYQANQPFLKVLDQEKENTRISVQARSQLYSMNRMKEILIPHIAADLGVDIQNPNPRLIATAMAAMFDAYHYDAVLAKVPQDSFLDQVCAMAEVLMTASPLD